ncbi:MAG: DnaJ-like protein [Acidimicrobiales bacterium]|nr:DnaJ-like protein [Acidimicrobiales bacterium]
MDAREAARVLGVAPDLSWPEVQRSFRALIRARHPDHAGDAATADAALIIQAFAVLDADHRHAPSSAPDPATAAATRQRRAGPPAGPPLEPTTIVRLDDDTLAFGAPADEVLGLLIEAAHDIGEVSYLDRSVPILEAICQFVGAPATSLVVTLQGRSDGTEAFCTTESIEARPGPPTKDVVDVFESLLRQRQAAVTPAASVRGTGR